MKNYDKIFTSTINTFTENIWPVVHCHWHKKNYFNILYLMYFTYVSYITRPLLKVYVINKYQNSNILIRSYSSRGLIPKKCELHGWIKIVYDLNYYMFLMHSPSYFITPIHYLVGSIRHIHSHSSFHRFNRKLSVEAT